MSKSQLILTMSGQEFSLHAVKMNEFSKVQEWHGLIATAQELLGGFSTGIGVLSSPEVAVASAAAIGLFESIVSNANQKKGLRYLAQAADLANELRKEAVFVSVDEIAGIDRPQPSEWHTVAQGDVEIDLDQFGFIERNRIQNELGATFMESMKGKVVRPGNVKSMITFPDEFVTALCGSRTVSFRWSSVETFFFDDCKKGS